MGETLTSPQAERWAQVKDLFAAALSVPINDREAFVEARCLHDRALRDEVYGLLQAYGASQHFLETAAGQVGALEMLPQEGVQDEDWSGKRLGVYRLLRRVGEGGMGVVYLAERDDDLFRKQVAIKILRATHHTRQHHRFQREQKILAGLNHPNIAQLYDGGVTEEGVPYLVMEYVKGEAIDTYCDAHQLSLTKRLRLFAKVCAAVRYAHQNLVVHRDLKPGNIWVTAEGEPKLLDFGIAKLLGADEGEEARTRTRDRMMTPGYASPEQIQGGVITTATDVYGLGMVLFRLLTGHSPYQVETNSLFEVERAICEQPPRKPSVVVAEPMVHKHSDGTETRQSVAEISTARSMPTERLQRQLAGDLDTVVLTALRKVPARRYGSVAEFAQDVDRYLKGRPVTARRDTVSYRVHKFVKRHQMGVVLAAVIAAFALTAVVTIVMQSRQLTRQLAETDAANSYMQSLFDISDPEQIGDSTITVRQLLDTGLRNAQVQFKDQPDRLATILNRLGSLYEKRGWYRRAIEVNDLALQMRRQDRASEDAGLAESYQFLASSYHAWGNYDQAEARYRQALNVRLRVLGPEHLDVAESMNDLASLLYDQDDLEEAEILCREALRIRRAQLSRGRHEEIGESMNLLALIIQESGDYETTETLLLDALEIRRTVLGRRHLKVASTLNNLAVLYQGQGRFEQAETYMQEALKIEQETLGREHPSVATSLNNYARLLREQGDLDQAEMLYRQALMIRKQYFGDNHRVVATSLNNVAYLLRQKGAREDARPLYEEAIAIWKKTLGPDHPDVAVGMHNLAMLLRDLKQYETAAEQYEAAIRIYEKAMPQRHTGLAGALLGLAKLHVQDGRPDAAEPLFRRALDVRQAHLEPGHWRIASLQSQLGACLVQLQKYQDAEVMLRSGYETLQTALGETDTKTVDARRRLDALYAVWHS